MEALRILEELDTGILLVSEKGEVEFANGYLIARGLLKEEWKGRRYYEAIKSMKLISFIHDLLDGESAQLEYEERGGWYRLYGKKLGELHLIHVQDITELKRCEISQKEFLANVSHELKTPIAVVKATLETLWEEEDEKRKRFIERALGRLKELIEIIDSIYYLTFLELSRAKKFSEVHLEELVDEVLSQRWGEIKEKDLKVQVDIPKDLRVEGDYEKLKILFSNLLDNSIKYNRQGGYIGVIARVKEGFVEVSVKDTGKGIEPKTVPFIFQPFFKGEDGEGLGLGLSIADKIARFHGTRVEVESQSSEGTTFRVRLKKV